MSRASVFAKSLTGRPSALRASGLIRAWGGPARSWHQVALLLVDMQRHDLAEIESTPLGLGLAQWRRRAHRREASPRELLVAQRAGAFPLDVLRAQFAND